MWEARYGMDAPPPAPPRIPIRTSAAAATADGRLVRKMGRRHRAARSALWPPNPGDFGHPAVIPRRNRATGV